MSEKGRAMIVDAHVHVFPTELIEQRQRLLADPAFGLLYSSPKARLASSHMLIEMMAQEGLDAAVVCAFPWSDPGLCRQHNAYLLEQAKTDPRRLWAVASVDATADWAVSEAERALADGALGLGEIGVYQRDFAEDDVQRGVSRLAWLCAEADKPLLLHTNEPVGHTYPGKSPMTLRGLYGLVKRCPDTRFQLAHLGGGIFFYEYLRKDFAAVFQNCVYDMAATPFLYGSAVFCTFLSLCGVERLLFGSDFPLLGLQRYLRALRSCGIEQSQVDRIMGKNACDFWARHRAGAHLS